MAAKPRVIGIIPARGSNDDVDHLNIKELGGRPMVVYSIERALKSRLLDRVIVSTEDRKTAEIARKAGGDVPFLRPPGLSAPSATLRDVVLHALSRLETAYDVVVTLLPNSPFRTPDDIDNAIEMHAHGRYDMVISVVEERDFFWGLNGEMLTPLTHKGVVQRKECVPIYRSAGGIEVCGVKKYAGRGYPGKKIGYYKMKEHNAKTINSVYDLLVSERLIKLPGSLIDQLLKSK